MIGNIAPGEVILDRQRINLTPQQRVCDQALQFRGKDQAAVAERGIEQRLYAEPVARKEQCALPKIVNRKGEHTVQPGQAIRAPALPGRQNNLAITVSVERRAKPAQFLAQFAVVIDLAVEHQHRPAVG